MEGMSGQVDIASCDVCVCGGGGGSEFVWKVYK